jgi:lariat debranching enzyme
MLISGRVDIMLSHDWPQGVCHHGNLQQLLRAKPFLKQDIDSGELGNPHAMHLMRCMRPAFWFSAHMHCKFPALVHHASPDPDPATATRFLALDKVCATLLPCPNSYVLTFFTLPPPSPLPSPPP